MQMMGRLNSRVIPAAFKLNKFWSFPRTQWKSDNSGRLIQLV